MSGVRHAGGAAGAAGRANISRPIPDRAGIGRRTTGRANTGQANTGQANTGQANTGAAALAAIGCSIGTLVFAVSLAAVANAAAAADYRTTTEPATVLYDAPSHKAKQLFLFGRDTPLEVIVALEGWTKVRDATGTIGWVEKRGLADKRVLIVRTHTAEVRANPEDAAPVVFRAERNVVLELAEPASAATATATPGWVKVRHRDGQTGFVRINQVFGF
ncbi:MAG: SH3 domain-containing protein [Casimicrobiaceae bacterium]